MTGDPYKYFRVEAREILQGITQGALELEKGSAASDGVASLLRLAHTLKGASRVVRQPAIAELAHSMEGVLAPHRGSRSVVPKESVNQILELADGIASRLADLETPAKPNLPAPVRPPAEDVFETVRVEVDEVEALLENLSEASVQLTAVRTQAGEIGSLKRMAVCVLEQLTAGLGTGAPRTRALAADLVDSLEKLDRTLANSTEQAEREFGQVRERADCLRLMPAASIFAALARSVRDSADSLGKRVELVASGGGIRVEAHVLLVLRDALLQLVRNAVAHGIEVPAARLAAGKPPTGRIDVQFEQRGARLTFLCKDDGQGINVEAVRQAAVKQGTISGARAASLTVEEAVALLLGGGISTTGTVTHVSGRGIGLDLVRQAAAGLKGEAKIRTTAGEGTTVEISVPVSVASLPALTMHSAGRVSSIPLDSVRQTLRIADAEIVRSASQESIVFEGATIPFLPLSEVLGGRTGAAARRERWSAVVVAYGPKLAAVGVDRLLGLGTAVVRKLPALAVADPLIGGASLDSEGNPCLVLDPAGLVEASHNRAHREVSGSPARLPILVIDDSLTTRMLEQSILESAGYTVEVAVSAEEALEKARATRYGLFLVDVEMPGMDGFTFVAKTRSDPVLRDVPAILVTSRNSPADLRQGQEAGASAYVVKSEFDQDSLLRTIGRLVGAR